MAQRGQGLLAGQVIGHGATISSSRKSGTLRRQVRHSGGSLVAKGTQYGTTYMVISSQTVVTATAKLVDLRSGTTLWTGTATASSDEGGNNSGGGLIGMLITAAVKQIINSSTDAGHPIAGITSQRLLSAGQPAGLLYGPRSPRYGTD